MFLEEIMCIFMWECFRLGSTFVKIGNWIENVMIYVMARAYKNMNCILRVCKFSLASIYYFF